MPNKMFSNTPTAVEVQNRSEGRTHGTW